MACDAQSDAMSTYPPRVGTSTCAHEKVHRKSDCAWERKLGSMKDRMRNHWGSSFLAGAERATTHLHPRVKVEISAYQGCVRVGGSASVTRRTSPAGVARALVLAVGPLWELLALLAVDVARVDILPDLRRAPHATVRHFCDNYCNPLSSRHACVSCVGGIESNRRTRA